MKKSTKKSIITSSSRETQKAGAVFGAVLAEFPLSSQKHARVIALRGELGSGKTTFAQGVAKGLGIKEKILSPTFVIIKSYKTPNTRYQIQRLYHIDCYRIKDERDLLSLGWDKIVSDHKNIALVEWPERIRKILPKDTISISFKTLKSSKSPARRITF